MKTFLTLVFVALFHFGFSQEKFEQASVEKFQKEINTEYADAKTSPLLPEDLAVFKSLDFYPINKTFFVTAKIIKSQNEKPFQMKTSTSRLPKFIKYGEVHFEIEGVKCKLNLYQSLDSKGNIEGKEDFRKTIEMMTVATLKEITKEDVSDQEKEYRILEEMLKMKDRS